MKILVVTDISVFQFYRYIDEYFKKNLGSLKLIKTYENIEKKL